MLIQYESFAKYYGKPEPDTGVELGRLQLSHSVGLTKFVNNVGCGIFADGFISFVSVRECVDDLGGWQYWLPADCRLFGCTAFGMLMATQGENVWIVETQYGQVVESDYSIEDFIVTLTAAETQDEIMRVPLFNNWNKIVGNLPHTSILCPTPALPLGGRWSVDTLSVMDLSIYLSFTGQMFRPDGGMPAEVLRL